MRKILVISAFIGCVIFSSCSVNYICTTKLQENYETKINHTTFLGKALFKRDKMKEDTYKNVKVFLNEQEIGRDFEVIAYGSYTPLIIPLIMPERPKVEKRLLWKAARKSRKLGADGTIIDSKNGECNLNCVSKKIND